MEFHVIKFAPTAFCPVSRNNWKEPVSLTFIPSHDVSSVMGEGGWDVPLLRHLEPTKKNTSTARQGTFQ